MKNILNYQTSEYDCAPTTLANAFRYLFDRERIPPEVLKAISAYTMDLFGENGEPCRKGTSQAAMRFFAHWLDQFGRRTGFPVFAEFIERESVQVGSGDKLSSCVRDGGAAVIRIWHGGEGHYVLMTDVTDVDIGIFDPYYPEGDPDVPGVCAIGGAPHAMNLRVSLERLNSDSNGSYSFGAFEKRAAILIGNKELL